ncbi:ABC transporter permease [Bradyrhizobium canariense]|uniref:NitT/TauT family transport system permease protein/sulfonate transport system permease protein n=1 Tax=Bradyrhizobium canariense TaxID=255045 RepID=A0A1H2B680_9BRAD|nr:ABC transporter permease [Bradyrhizobium canariense]SDT53587.1 NitT/TauT family transport system permease protein/sulfonate transport system permease protein [Bradyrhizobium canariense]
MTILTTSDRAPRTGAGGEGAASAVPSTAHTPTPTGSKTWNRLSAVARYYPVFLIFLIWEVLSRLNVLDPMFMPPLEDVARTFYQQVFVTHELLSHIEVSFMRAGMGLGLAAVVGIAAGILMGRIRAVESFLDPLISALFPTPKLALFPLMMIFLGIGDASKIALIFLGCFFPIVINTYTGVKNVDKFFVWNALTKGASQRQLIWHVIIPASLPFVFAGLRVATSTAFLLIVASELIAANDGLGYLIMFAERSFDPALMWCGILVIAGMGFAVDRLLLALGARLFVWQDK